MLYGVVMSRASLSLSLFAGLVGCQTVQSRDIACGFDNIDTPSDPSFSPDLELFAQTLDAQPPAAVSDSGVELHVSPDGSDAAAGTREAPLRTFLGARDRVREIRDEVSGHITVLFHEGEYVFEQTVVLGPEDSGADDQSIVYAAAPGETPVFTSLVPLTDWSPTDGGLIRARLPDGVEQVRFLWSAAVAWMPRSETAVFITDEPSTVDEGCLECNWDTPEAQSARYNTRYPDDFNAPDWSKAAQYDLRTSVISWTQEILPIERVDVGEQRIYTTIPASLEMRLNYEEAENLNRNWVLNSLAGIDAPNAWAALDGYIYLSADTDTTDIRVPTLTEFIRVDDGTMDGNAEVSVPVRHLRFAGLTFTGGDFYTMTSQDITVQHDWSVVDAPTAMLRLRNTADIVIEDCVFEKSGSTALRMDRLAQDNVIYGNTFSQLGREAVLIVGRGPGYGDVSTRNEIARNHITYTGMEKWTAPAVVVDQSSNNLIHHNYIANTRFTAIVLTAPRQLAFASLYEAQGAYPGREFHYAEVADDVLALMAEEDDEIQASYQAMTQVYNTGNLVELNTIIDACEGSDSLVNGIVYNSASPLGGSNTISYNYIHSTQPGTVNNAAFYSDSDQDYANYVGNMISGLNNADAQPEPMPILLLFAMYAEGEINEGTRVAALGNAIADSTHGFEFIDGVHFGLGGTLIDESGGNPAFDEIYEEMSSILIEDALPSVGALPGKERMLAVIAYGTENPSTCAD